MNIYQDIIKATKTQKKLLAILIDPDKMAIDQLPSFFEKLHKSTATHIFIGGSTDLNNNIKPVVTAIKNITNLPVVLFPGDVQQITSEADGILFLSLISGRNPTYLIDQQVKAVPFLKNASLEIIPTGYILIDGGKETAVQRVSQTKPIPQKDHVTIVHTALAGAYSGKKLIYLEAGSGAKTPVHPKTIQKVSEHVSIPLIVGGGIRSLQQLNAAYNAGADMVVIGTAFEKDASFFEDLKKQ